MGKPFGSQEWDPANGAGGKEQDCNSRAVDRVQLSAEGYAGRRDLKGSGIPRF